ncbi:type 1 glutamine amidotransferase [Herbiconiux sp. L3-i23]|uniref:type 1 glutamine amidotransferase n=1 Tax=Herbiconiux sp. L3-i23 TaxID=2905871 RepID=UPI00205FE810|nr:hypothetical protein [Herbiconiux sp. L3-i23]BDI22887.1 glutamine amidotransferase [Herbiconiux sp. L3-i23]
MTFRILQLLPQLTDVNGDARNAAVLVARLRWAGHDADLVPVAAGEPLPAERPTAIVLGSGVDSALRRTRDALAPMVATLTSWLGDGVPLLAVGTGMELLGRAIPLGDGTIVDGLGIVPGEATPLATRSADDLVVESRYGTLTGYENHARGFVLASPAEPLGTVLTGTGNGEGAEGIRWQSVYGTHLHGPVLARNPVLADALLADAGVTVVASEMSARADAIAARVSARLMGSAR